MYYRIITFLLIVLTLCHGQISKGGSEIIVNNVTEPIPAVSDVTDSPPTPSTTTKPTTLIPPTTNATTASPTTPTTVTTPSTTTTNSTTSTHSPTPSPNTTTVKPTSPPTPTSTSTIAPTKSAPTKAPVTTPSPSPANNRKFDGPSFVGGIVLASGLMAIGFVAFKFYKARTELNYHTL